jgi:cell division protein FtsN
MPSGQAQLARQSISANVQRVALDADVWYRIRIGPIKDLNQLNRVRQQLQAAETCRWSSASKISAFIPRRRG